MKQRCSKEQKQQQINNQFKKGLTHQLSISNFYGPYLNFLCCPSLEMISHLYHQDHGTVM